MAASLLLQSSVLRLPSSSFNRNFFSDFTFRRSTVTYMPRASLFDEPRLAQTLISAPRPLQSLKFCCTGRGENLPSPSIDGNGDGEEKEYPVSAKQMAKRKKRSYAEFGAPKNKIELVFPIYYSWGDFGPFDFSADDLASDESMWELYHRWCMHFNSGREIEEMRLRFDHFKDSLKSAYNSNGYLTEYSDMSPGEQAQAVKFGSDALPVNWRDII